MDGDWHGKGAETWRPVMQDGVLVYLVMKWSGREGWLACGVPVWWAVDQLPECNLGALLCVCSNAWSLPVQLVGGG